MRIYANAYELMSELGRNLYEMGQINAPKSYQNKNIEGNPSYVTKELICEQYCLLDLPDPENLLAFIPDAEKIKVKGWLHHEFAERIHVGDYVNPGNAYKDRLAVWEQFLVNGKFDYSYNERICHKVNNHEFGNNLGMVLGELKRNPATRQAIIPIFSLDDPQYIGGEKRIPCSMYYQLLIRDDAKGNPVLHIAYHQRSSDLVTHFGNDVALAVMLRNFIAEMIEVKPGYLYHTIDSLHSYQKDWDMLKAGLTALITTDK